MLITAPWQIASRDHRTLEHVVAALEDIYRHGPRFHHYIVRLTGSSPYEPLKSALAKYRAELDGFCQDSVSYLQSKPYSE